MKALTKLASYDIYNRLTVIMLRCKVTSWFNVMTSTIVSPYKLNTRVGMR